MTNQDETYYADLELIVRLRIKDTTMRSQFLDSIRDLENEVLQYLISHKISYISDTRILKLIDTYIKDEAQRLLFSNRFNILQISIVNHIKNGQPFLVDDHVVGNDRISKIKGDPEAVNVITNSKDSDIYAASLSKGDSVMVFRN